jgi:hypothetical protein
MDTCTEEVGLLKKKPCGSAAVTHCATCEQALCSQHAVAQVTPGGKKTGKFMCKEHYAAWLAYEKSKESAPAPKAAASTPAKPAAPAAAPKPAAPGAAKEFKPEDTGPLEFTPTKKKP